MNRRTLLVGGAAATGTLALGAVGVLLTGPGSPNATLAAVHRKLDAVAAGGFVVPGAAPWSAGMVFTHLARSVAYSLDGYPVSKSAFFQRTAGAAALAVFAARGAMHHGTLDPIPGAPPLVEVTAEAGLAHLREVLAAFEASERPLAPHFAYGHLDKAAYTVAHALHVQDHLGPLEGV